MTLTSLILARLWRCKVQLRKTLGDGYGKHYSILSTVFIESAFMNAVCSILLLASSSYGLVSPVRATMGLLLDVWISITPAIQVGPSHPSFFPHPMFTRCLRLVRITLSSIAGHKGPTEAGATMLLPSISQPLSSQRSLSHLKMMKMTTTLCKCHRFATTISVISCTCSNSRLNRITISRHFGDSVIATQVSHQLYEG